MSRVPHFGQKRISWSTLLPHFGQYDIPCCGGTEVGGFSISCNLSLNRVRERKIKLYPKKCSEKKGELRETVATSPLKVGFESHPPHLDGKHAL